MREPENYWIESRAEFHTAVLRVLAMARHQVMMMDPNFDDWDFQSKSGTAGVTTALEQIRALGSAQVSIKMLFHDTDWFSQKCPTLVSFKKRQSAYFDTRLVPAEYQKQDSVIIVDRQHAVIRPHKTSFRARVVIGQPSEVEPRLARLDQLFDLSAGCLHATTLGL